MKYKHVPTRPVRWLLVLMSVFWLSACAPEVDESKIYERNGLAYEIGKEAPFSGVVTGTSRGEDYRRKTVSFKKEYKNGLLHGRSYYYYANGKIESIEPYEKGVLHGVVTRYYDNGQIGARIHFVDGYRGGAKGEMFWDKEGNRRNG